MVIALAPILAVMVFGAAPTVVVPIVAAASTHSVGASVAVEEQQLAQRELYGH